MRCFVKVILILLLFSPDTLPASEGADALPRTEIFPEMPQAAGLRFLPYKSLIMTNLDKVKHFSMSLMLVTAGGYTLTRYVDQSGQDALKWSIGVSATFGMGKEVYDSAHPQHHSSWGDLLADALGIVAGGIILHNMP